MVVRVVRPASVGPCDPSPHCIEARRVAWQQLLSVLMGYNYIGIVSFLHYHQYTALTAGLFIRKITAQQRQQRQQKPSWEISNPLHFNHQIYFIQGKMFSPSMLFVETIYNPAFLSA